MLKRVKEKFAGKIRSVHKDPNNKSYPEELKAAVRKEVSKGVSRYEVAKILGISYTLIHTWCK